MGGRVEANRALAPRVLSSVQIWESVKSSSCSHMFLGNLGE